MNRIPILLLAAGLAVAAEPTIDWRSQVKTKQVQQPEVVAVEAAFTTQPFPAIAVVAAQQPDPVPLYGCYSWGGEYRQFRKEIREVGFTTYRLGGFIDDAAIQLAMADGIEIMHTLQIGETLADLKGPGKRDAFASDEAFITAFIGVLDRFCRRYGPGGSLFGEHPELAKNPVRHLEIWNEPNFKYMIGDQPDAKKVMADRDALYAKLLRAAYTAVKKDHPQISIVGFAAGGSAFDDKRFITNVHALDPAIGACYDILSTHPYTHTPPMADRVRGWGSYSVTTGWKAIQDILAANQVVGKPIWYTEVGWPIRSDDGGTFPHVRKIEMQFPAMQQAACVVKMYLLASRLGVRRVHVMSTCDADGFNSGFFNRKDGEWRPVAYAVQQLIRVMPRPRIQAAPAEVAGGLYAYRFQSDWSKPGAPEVIVAWHEQHPGELSVPIPPGAKVARVQNMLGGEIPFTVTATGVSFAGGPLPCYVTLAP